MSEHGSERLPFYKYLIAETMRAQSIADIYDRDINKECHVVHNQPIDITPKIISQNQIYVPYQNPQTLFIYPSKEDFSENDSHDSEQLAESIYDISKPCAYEIRGNKIEQCLNYYGERDDLEIIDPAVKNYFPKTITEIGETKEVTGNYHAYVLVPNGAFFESLTTHKDSIVNPINLITQLFLKIDENEIGIFQFLMVPLPEVFHQMIEESINCVWNAQCGGTDRVLPSLQAGVFNKRLTYKAPDFKNNYGVCARLFLPNASLTPHVRAFISNFTLGNKPFRILDNSYFTNEQILEMINKRLSYVSSFPLNTNEVTSFTRIPFKTIKDKKFNGIFLSAPAGDTPLKTLTYPGISVGTYACGKNKLDVKLPSISQAANILEVGKPRTGKTLSIISSAIKKVVQGETVVFFDPNGDGAKDMLRSVPEHMVDDTIYLDFTRSDATPQITIRDNTDILRPDKAADDLAEGMRNVTSGKEKFFGPKMSYWFLCLFYILNVLPEIDLTHLRQLVSTSRAAKMLRTKIKSKISHPVVRDFLDELNHANFEARTPVLTRLSHLLLPVQSLRFFTNKINRVSIGELINGTAKLIIINLSIGSIGKQRTSIIGAILNCLFNNNIMSRDSILFEDRMPLTLIFDEAHIFPIDFETQLVFWPKTNAHIWYVGQYLTQIEEQTRDALDTCGTKIFFSVRRRDAEIISKELNLDPSELTDLEKFSAFMSVDSEVVKINTPRPEFNKNKEDYSAQIIENSINKYYLKHGDDDIFSDEKKFEFDEL